MSEQERTVSTPAGRGQWPLIIAAVLCALVTAAMIGKFRAGDFKDAEVWYDAGRRVLTGQTLAQLPHYRYPPTFAVLVAPLCALGFGVFFFLWYAVNVLLFGLSARAATRLVFGLEQPVPVSRCWLPALLVAVFAIDNLFLGQTNILVTALIYWSLLDLERGREWRAGLPLGAAISIKVFPAPLLAYFLYRGRLRLATNTLAWCAVFFLLLPAPVRGFGRNLAEVGDWGKRVVMPFVSRGEAGDWGQHSLDFGNQSLPAVARRYLTHVDAQVMARRSAPIYVNIAELSPAEVNRLVLALSAVLGLAFLAACGLPGQGVKRPQQPDERAVEYSLAILLLLLLSAITWTYFFVMLLLPVMVALRLLEARAKLRPSSVWGLRVAVWALVLAIVLLANHHVRALGSLFWVALLFFAALALARRDLRRPAPETTLFRGPAAEENRGP